MRLKDLNEGIIDVPEIIIKKALYELKIMAVVAVHNELPSKEVWNKFIESIPSEYFVSEDDIPKYSIKDNDCTSPITVKFPMNIKYTERRGLSEFRLVGRDGSSTTSDGAYSSKYNAIFINMYSLINRIQGFMNIWYDDVTISMTPEEQAEDFVKSKGPDSLLKHVNNFLETSRGVMKHELAHMIQYQFLSPKDPSQVKQGNLDDVDSYYNSNVEFSPQIISTFENIKLIYQKVSDADIESKSLMKKIFDTVVGISDDHIKVSDFVDTSGASTSAINDINFLVSPRQGREFFLSLKNKNKEQWRKAVKYMYTELYKEGIL